MSRCLFSLPYLIANSFISDCPEWLAGLPNHLSERRKLSERTTCNLEPAYAVDQEHTFLAAYLGANRRKSEFDSLEQQRIWPSPRTTSHQLTVLSNMATALGLKIGKIGQIGPFSIYKRCLGHSKLKPLNACQSTEQKLSNVCQSTKLRSLAFEDIGLLVGQAVALWPRAAAGDLRLSTASKRMCCLPFVEISHEDIPLLISTY